MLDTTYAKLCNFMRTEHPECSAIIEFAADLDAQTDPVVVSNAIVRQETVEYPDNYWRYGCLQSYLVTMSDLPFYISAHQRTGLWTESYAEIGTTVRKIKPGEKNGAGKRIPFGGFALFAEIHEKIARKAVELYVNQILGARFPEIGRPDRLVLQSKIARMVQKDYFEISESDEYFALKPAVADSADFPCEIRVYPESVCIGLKNPWNAICIEDEKVRNAIQSKLSDRKLRG